MKSLSIILTILLSACTSNYPYPVAVLGQNEVNVGKISQLTNDYSKRERLLSIRQCVNDDLKRFKPLQKGLENCYIVLTRAKNECNEYEYMIKLVKNEYQKIDSGLVTGCTG